MKATYRYFTLVMAAVVAMTSCEKELGNGLCSDSADGARVISVSFDSATKAGLGGTGNLTPSFVNGDLVMVSDGTSTQVCTVKVDGTAVNFTTTLSESPLTAVYPSDAAKLSNDGKTITGFKVKKAQSGLQKDAIIAKADNFSSIAVFTVRTAIFQITPPEGVKQFKIQSLRQVIYGGRQNYQQEINTEGASYSDKYVITVGDNASALGTYYVSLLPGVKLSDLSFDAGGTDGMKGIPLKDIEAAGKADQTAENTLYKIGSDGWHQYVEIEGLKWATENIGATGTNPNGKYFAWGDVDGQVPSSSTTFSTSFDWNHAPFNNNQADYDATYFTSVRNNVCNHTSKELALQYDAAYVNWGGAWRIPTHENFVTLMTANRQWDGEKIGYKFGTSPNQIFLPAAGQGDGTTLKKVGESGYYWSSSLNEHGLNFASFLEFNATPNAENTILRYYGQSIRPVAD